MILPMMLQIDFTKIKDVSKNPQGLFLTLIINWLIKPFTMFLMASFFMKYVFGTYIPEDTAQSYIAGMILLGVAPCTAMVFVWSYLMKGDANYTLIQVSINDVIMFIKKEIKLNNQIFWVCPLIDESKKLDHTSSKKKFEYLNKIFPNKVALLHGKTSIEDKETILNKII